MHDYTCPFKCQVDRVYVFGPNEEVRPYAELSICGDITGPGVVYDDRAQMFLPRAFYKDVFLEIQAPICKMDDCRYVELFVYI